MIVTAYQCHLLKDISLQVIPLDITVELQKQIMSELEILYKVGFDLSYLSLITNTVSLCCFPTTSMLVINH